MQSEGEAARGARRDLGTFRSEAASGYKLRMVATLPELQQPSAFCGNRLTPDVLIGFRNFQFSCFNCFYELSGTADC
jgi:hypothetical protein